MAFQPILRASPEEQNLAFENRKHELHAQLKALLGPDYVVDIDTRAVWQFVQMRSRRDFGTLLWLHVEGFISALQKFITMYGEPGRTCFNGVVTQRKITLSANPHGIYSDTISATIRDGVYRILFHPDRFGVAGVVPSMHHTARSIHRLVDREQLSMNILGGASLAPLETAKDEVVRELTWDKAYTALQVAGMPVYATNSASIRIIKECSENIRARPDRQDDAVEVLIEELSAEGGDNTRALFEEPEPVARSFVIENGTSYIELSPKELSQEVLASRHRRNNPVLILLP
ncbi:hypothetical protein C8F01DRAFT_1237017 [Mycena amicta]|nr:hypothetical protein C8F01DRAFT_1237017 [Mycena amicta]